MRVCLNRLNHKAFYVLLRKDEALKFKVGSSVRLPISACTGIATMISLRGATIVVFDTQYAYAQVHFPSLEHLTSSAHSKFLSVSKYPTSCYTFRNFPLKFPTKSGASKYPISVISTRNCPGGFLIIRVLDDEDEA